MPLPDVIPVRYTEEEAGYVSFRPVVRQSFRMHELLDMVVSVTGKDAHRIQQILRSGTVVFHFYRYWWQGFEAGAGELAPLLAQFPDADPSRAFRPEACTLALAEDDSTPPSLLFELDRARGGRRRFLRRRSFWQELLEAARRGPLAYAGYSYAQRGDLYRLDLTRESAQAVLAARERLAPSALRLELHSLDRAARFLFVCSREHVC